MTSNASPTPSPTPSPAPGAGVPFQRVLELAADAPEPWVTVGALAVGVAVGVVLALIGEHETLRLTVSDAGVSMSRMNVPSSAQRADVGAVFLDGKRLTLLGHR